MADDALRIDINDFTLLEVEEFEEATGVLFGEVLQRRTAKAMAGLVWIVRRRTDPSYTLEQAKADTKVGDIKWGSEQPDPTNAAG